MTARGGKHTALMYAVIIGAGSASAQAQTYPAKPIRVVVPFAPGGTSDILARLLGAKINESLGQQVLVDNRPGASGNIGTELVAKSSPDGYTLVLMDVGNLSISPSIFAKLPFDIIKDLAPVTVISYSPHLLCVHPSVPAGSVKQLIALARSKPGQLNYGSTGLGSAPHMAGLLFAQRTGVNWAYIPAKGGAQSILDVASGQADVLFNGMLATLPHVKNGKLKLIAVSSEKRMPTLSEVPTVGESGVPGFVTGSWQGILAPAGTPRDIVVKLQSEVARIVRIPDINEKLSQQGAEPIANTPEQMGEWLRNEQARWARLIKETGFKLEQ